MESPQFSGLSNLAERKGFEPLRRYQRLHDFQSCAFDQLSHLSMAPPAVDETGQLLHYSYFFPVCQYPFSKKRRFSGKPLLCRLFAADLHINNHQNRRTPRHHRVAVHRVQPLLRKARQLPHGSARAWLRDKDMPYVPGRNVSAFCGPASNWEMGMYAPQRNP